MSVLVIPIDASQILPDKERKTQQVKVAVQAGGKVKSQVVTVEPGRAEVKLEVDPQQVLDIAVGPASASDEDIFHMETLTARVSPRQWGAERSLTIPPIALTLYWWRRWLIWCRDFTIQGRVVCADGSPVPGAEVHAYDVDYFWWWSSISQVGPTAITDAFGHFTIKFRWCCGWWPWWWWKLRAWSLDPSLLEKIQPVLKLNPNLRFREPDPDPSFDVVTLSSQTSPPSLEPMSPALAAMRKVDPSVIPTLREKLVAVLPQVPELQRLRIWPWWPWTPWFDCTPDIIFRVNQNCGGGIIKTIVNESIFQARWDIPTSLNVTLVANRDACCIPVDHPEPEGDCALFTQVCLIPVDSIGGNSGAAASPVGYANPGGRDRPFSEVVNLYGQFGSSAQADYYEIEFTPRGTNAWAPVPPAALRDFYRGYFDATLPWPHQWSYPGFPVLTFGSKNVYESRHRYETLHPPANWGSPFGRSWSANLDLIASIQTAGNFTDGAYEFRIIGYRVLPNGDLDPATGKVMNGCGGAANNHLVLRLDNRVVGVPIPGSVHINTGEPDCGIIAVRIGPTTVLPCGTQQLQPGTPLEIDFFATDTVGNSSDPAGHLDHYDLKLKFDLGSYKNLLSTADVGSHTLTAISGGPAGPDYSNAVTPATRPKWNGGTMRLHIDDAFMVFPKTCCYLVELTVWKRNIVNCDGHLTYYNQMHYSFTVIR